MINIEKIEIDVANQGHITNCYLVYDENKEAILIDPADNPSLIISKIVNLNLKINYIVITHAHGDHIGALEELVNYTKAKVIINKNDYNMLIGEEENYCDILFVKQPNLNNEDILAIDNNYILKVGNLDFEIINTKGHSSGSVCIYEKNSNVLFTGDTLFADCYGRCDLNSGSFRDMVETLRCLFSRFIDIIIYPGHGKSVKIEVAKKYVKKLMALKGVHV